MFGGKRELLARGLFWSGATFLLGQLPERDLLLVLNYHRIGNADGDLFAHPGLFSTSDQLSDHISYLKRHVSLVTLDEALAFVDGTIHEKTRRCRVLITFDDGYLDNYEVACPILGWVRVRPLVGSHNLSDEDRATAPVLSPLPG